MEKAEIGECDSDQPAMPCANNCGFYGSPANLNFCSKCYQEHLKANPPLPSPQSNICSSIKEHKEKNSSETYEDKINISDLNASPTAVESENEKKDIVQENVAKQQDTTRCWDCNSKVGLLGFKCRCGFTYCKKHRQTEAHNCTFDYFAFHQEHLKRSTQKVVADKLERIQ